LNIRFTNSFAFHHLIYMEDQKTAGTVQAEGCQWCGGKLHQAHYPRLGFGLPRNLLTLYRSRISFCCASCRRRTTPPSLRFFGRRRYVSIIFVLLSALRSSPSERRCEQLSRRFGVPVSLATWKRWLSWWRLNFPQTVLWVTVKTHFALSTESTPITLLTQFTAKTLSQRLMQALVFLSPLTIGVI